MTHFNILDMMKVELKIRKINKGGNKMKEIKRVAKGIGKAMLAVLGGIFFPILIWVALGVVIAAMVTATKQKLGERRHQQVRVRAIG
jgi:hypothetical protein